MQADKGGHALPLVHAARRQGHAESRLTKLHRHDEALAALDEGLARRPSTTLRKERSDDEAPRRRAAASA